MICPKCNAENPNSNWYCDSCGSDLREPETTKAPRKRASKDASARPPSEPAQTFAGRYRGLEKIGDGAMATVYRATDTELDQVVALKVLKTDLASNEEFIARFKREISLARSITHPNVYRIYDIGTSGRVHFISMEYIEGTELKQLISRSKPSIEQALEFTRQICLALEQAHHKGIIHRDLKPHNIMVEKATGRCVVMDFGIAIGEQSSSITQTGAFVGTPEYISPEQAGSRPLDHTTDIYSLGVIMYELLSGKLPFGPGRPVTVAMQHMNEIPVAPSKHNKAISRRLEGIVLKAMSKDPLRRHQDAGELLAEIDSVLAAGSESDEPEQQVHVRAAVNPYLNRNMIRDKKFFYGRRKEVATIFSRIGAARPQSVSIVGERRIGKSSLLYFINDPENRDDYLDDSSSYIFLFMDFQEKRRGTAEEFFNSLFELLEQEAADRLGELPEPGYDGFKQVCELIDRDGLKLVMLFDEFEAITKNRNFEPEFFAFLRSLANNYNVAYVTSSVKNLQEMCHNREISDSPFFNIFSNLNLGAFTVQEAKKFVSEPSREAGNPLEEHFETVVELGGWFPFYMAIACSNLFDYDFEHADPRKSVLENVEEQFLEEAGMHFQFIVDSLGPDEIRVCRKLIEGIPLDSIDRFVTKGLLRRGYLIPGDSDREYRLFSRTFERMLQEHMMKQEVS